MRTLTENLSNRDRSSYETSIHFRWLRMRRTAGSATRRHRRITIAIAFPPASSTSTTQPVET